MLFNELCSRAAKGTKVSDRAYAKVQAQQKTLSGSASRSSLLQRTCACGGSPGIDGLCTGCREKRLTLPDTRRGFEASSLLASSQSNALTQENIASRGAVVARASRFGHDFSQIPIHAPSKGTLQPKLTINRPGDVYEQEAEQVAEQVMRIPETRLQRTCVCGGTCPKCQTGQPSQEQEHIQTRRIQASDMGQMTAPPIVHEVLHSSGQPLDPATRTFMEPRFGHDFSRVRMHTDTQAAESARSVNALAYTVGKDVVFGSGQYKPETSEGQRLLAHELTHVVQQNTTRVPNDIQLAHDPGNAPLERETESVANQVTQTTRTELLSEHISQPPLILQRKEDEAGEPSDAEKRQLRKVWETEAKADVIIIRLFFQDENIFSLIKNRREIMSIVRKWAEKPRVAIFKRTPFDMFVDAMQFETYTISSWFVDQWTSVFDQFYDRMSSEDIEQFNAWKQSQANYSRDDKPHEVVKFDAAQVLKEAGQLALELGCDALTEGACELAIIAKWLLVDLPDLYNKATAVIDLVNRLRNLKLDDVEKLFSATGLADLLLKALFGEVQSLPTLGDEQGEQETEAEPASGGDEKGLVKLLHGVLRVFSVLKRAYSRVTGVVNQILATVNITSKKWFKPFSMAYAGAVHGLEAISNPGAVLNDAAAQLTGVVETFFNGIKTKVGETVGEIKKRVEDIGNPAQLLHKLVDKAVEMALNLLITHPPSPAIKLLFKVIETYSKESIVQLVRDKVPLASKIIDKIANSDLVKETIVEPLKPAIASVTGAIDSVAARASGVIDNVEHTVEATLGDGAQMIKEFAGLAPTQAHAEATSGEGEAAKGTPRGQASGGFLAVFKQGIHDHLLLYGNQFLRQQGKSFGKATLGKLAQGVKGVIGKLLAPPVSFSEDKEEHELWVEEQGDDAVAYIASFTPRLVRDKIKGYRAALVDLKVASDKKKASKLIDDLEKDNQALKLAKRKGVQGIEPLEKHMTTLIVQLDALLPTASVGGIFHSEDAFMQGMLRRIRNRQRELWVEGKKLHPLLALVSFHTRKDGEPIIDNWYKTKTEGGFVGRFPGSAKHIVVQAGHQSSKVSGAREQLMLEEADQNKTSGEVIETPGGYSQKIAVLIEDIPVEISLARELEGYAKAGLQGYKHFPVGTVDSPKSRKIEPPPFPHHIKR